MTKNIKILQDNDKELLKSKSAQALPNSPSNRGWSADQIRSKLYEPQLLLFEWLKTFQKEIIDYLNVMEPKVDDITISIEKILDGRLTVKKTEQDSSGNKIIETYATILALNNLITNLTNGNQAVVAYLDDNGEKKNIKDIARDLSNMQTNLKNGNFVAKKAEQDEYGNNIANTYIKQSKIAKDKTSGDTSQLVTLAIVKELLNDILQQLVNGSVETLDTLKEIAEALGNDPNFASTITTLLGEKLSLDEAVKTYLTKESAADIYSSKEETRLIKDKIENFIDTWTEVPKIADLGCGRFAISYEEWIGDLGDGRYSFEVNL